MQTMQIANGDLVLSGGKMATVTGSTKVQQDLMVALREALGIDPWHPSWGSQLPSYVGSPNTEVASTLVQQEVRRVISNYMLVQRDQLSADAAAGKPPRFGAAEVVGTLNDVQVRANYDSLDVLVSLTLVSGEAITVFTSTATSN